MDNVYTSIEEGNTIIKRKILIIFNGMTIDSNKKLFITVTELFIRRKKLNISLVLWHNVISLFQKILIQHSILLCKFQTKESFNKSHLIIHQILTFKTLLIFIKNQLQNNFVFLVIDTTFASDKSSRFKKNLLEGI